MPPARMATPAVAIAVATSQRCPGYRLRSAQSSAPVMIGAEPSATTVPTATPFTAVPAKKAGW